jgi:hypothetical protein
MLSIISPSATTQVDILSTACISLSPKSIASWCLRSRSVWGGQQRGSTQPCGKNQLHRLAVRTRHKEPLSSMRRGSSKVCTSLKRAMQQPSCARMGDHDLAVHSKDACQWRRACGA